MRVPDNLDIYEMHEREEARRERRRKRINRLTALDLEKELGFKTVEEANKEREENEKWITSKG